MKFKNIFLITIILLAIFSISSISAEEIADNGTNIISEDLDSNVISIDEGSADTLIQNSTPEGDENGTSSIQSSDLVKYYKNDTQYKATFFDGEGNPLIAQKIPISINGGDYSRTTNQNGTITFPINLNAGNYTISVTNPSTNETASNKVTVLSTLKSDDLVKTYRNDTQYEILVMDGQGNPLANTVVTFNINGVFYTRTTNSSGYAGLNINLPPGTYTVTAEYNGLKASNKIAVLSILETKDLSMKYHDGSKFEAKILDGQGKAYSGQTVNFNINGVFYSKETDEDGIARLNINLMAGEYIITSMFNGLNAANKVTISG